MKNPSVFVGIPSGADWKADFGMSLAGMMASAARPLKGKDGFISKLQLWNTKGSILSRSRETLAQQAIEAECDYLLFVDSDMTFPNFTLHQLLSHNKDVVAANCVTKVLPALPTARHFKKGVPAGELIDSRKRNGLEKVWRVGTGVMLVKTSVFQKMPKPWFPITWNDANQDYTGEDWNFCEKCRDIGVDIFIDHTLSKHIGHIGAFEFGVSHQEN